MSKQYTLCQAEIMAVRTMPDKYLPIMMLTLGTHIDLLSTEELRAINELVVSVLVDRDPSPGSKPNAHIFDKYVQ
jgi:hypothetical protein